MDRQYEIFARYIGENPEADGLQAIRGVLRMSGYSVDPNKIMEWWQQWHELKGKLKQMASKDSMK